MIEQGNGSENDKDQNPASGANSKRRRKASGEHWQPHGFYSRHFNRQEQEDVGKLTGSLADEIAMLRVISRRAFEFASENEPGSLEEWAKVLSALGSVNTRIAGLIKQSFTMEKDQDAKNKTISQAIADVVRELGCQ